jgi:hypothetical protein
MTGHWATSSLLVCLNDLSNAVDASGKDEMAATAGEPSPAAKDDWATVCAISILAGMIADVLHEGVGHALVALLTVARSGTLTTVAWSSAYDSKLVAAGGTLVNLASAGVFWLLLRKSREGSVHVRLFLLLCCAFNLFDGTGYFFFSGVSNFGDWAVVIAGMKPHVFWRRGNRILVRSCSNRCRARALRRRATA